MTANDIERRLKTMIVERLFLDVEPEELQTDASLMDVYGVDSVCLLELVVGLEDEFGIQIGDGDFNVKNFESVAALKEFVEQHLDAQ